MMLGLGVPGLSSLWLWVVAHWGRERQKPLSLHLLSGEGQGPGLTVSDLLSAPGPWESRQLLPSW